VLTLEIDQDGWGLLLPPLGHLNLKRLLVAIAAVSRCPPGATLLSEPRLGGVLPSDCDGHWQALGFSADPGVLEVNLPVRVSWSGHRLWLKRLDAAGAAVGLRSWKQTSGGRAEGTGGGDHRPWGGPSLEPNPFFRRPAWLVGSLRS
jgi:uncharacterized protein (DUF2126 family)